jgi:hypothetical protein
LFGAVLFGRLAQFHSVVWRLFAFIENTFYLCGSDIFCVKEIEF